ncbi:MAG: hypothetical protein NC098_06725 [Lachnoclostridium sp.]|nr:hypothetical protein [Lachnoclostridium sp.]
MRQNLRIFVHLLLMALFSISLCSCRTSMPVGQSGGAGDRAYLLIVSSHDNVGKSVDVLVDDQTTFESKAEKQKNQYAKGTTYQITPGKHKIVVSRKGKKLYDKYIYVSSNETKILNIP